MLKAPNVSRIGSGSLFDGDSPPSLPWFPLLSLPSPSPPPPPPPPPPAGGGAGGGVPQSGDGTPHGSLPGGWGAGQLSSHSVMCPVGSVLMTGLPSTYV